MPGPDAADVTNGDASRTEHTRHGWRGRLDRLPAGGKLFLILSGALLPLALVAFFAAYQANRLADQEMRSRLRVAASEATRALNIELIGDANALRVALKALDRSPADAARCAQAQGVFAEQKSAGARFVILDASGHAVCGQARAGDGMIARQTDMAGLAAAITRDGALAVVIGGGGTGTENSQAMAVFPVDFLARIARPSGFAPPFAARLVVRHATITLADLPGLTALDRTETIDLPLGVADLRLVMTVRSAPLTSALVIAMLLPFLMWAAAAGISWLVVDLLLIRPLRDLRRAVAAYTPGAEIDPGIARAVPAQEIRELGETFQAISRTVMLHEAELADGLLRQTKLTREVHHRVKNNLQVIASLINFHARGATSPGAAAAYASIQRRVDALAVVHRNHFAELEENRGLSLRAIIGDLVSNNRATASDAESGIAIVLDLDSWYVTQDVATPVAFLITELIELAMITDPKARIRVALQEDTTPDRVLLIVESDALADRPDHPGLDSRYGRILEGLARQLRSRLDRDSDRGRFAISIAVTGRE